MREMTRQSERLLAYLGPMSGSTHGNDVKTRDTETKLELSIRTTEV
jgi:hypothetical protein